MNTKNIIHTLAGRPYKVGDIVGVDGKNIPWEILTGPVGLSADFKSGVPTPVSWFCVPANTPPTEYVNSMRLFSEVVMTLLESSYERHPDGDDEAGAI